MRTGIPPVSGAGGLVALMQMIRFAPSVQQLAGALGKLQKQLNNPDLAKYEFIDFPLDRHEFAHWIARRSRREQAVK